MTIEPDTTPEPRLLFTAPWEPIIVRRGDALGLRALTDEFADAIAPDLSNRILDGRWVTILAWCLVRSQEVFHASGGRSVVTRAQQRERYAWLRPLELMWVARTIALTETEGEDQDTSLIRRQRRSLAGQRRVRPWYKDYKQSPDRFGMSADQYRAYRQTGMYGGYRLAFRKWPGMTQSGNGWTPSQATIELALWLDKKLGKARPPGWALNIGNSDEKGVSVRKNKSNQDREYRWWLRKWSTYTQGGSKADINTLPRPRDEFAPLPEADLLKPLVFGNDPHGSQRLKVAREVHKASANTHIELCKHLGTVFDDPTIKLLPHFSRLADAGMEAMDLIAEELSNCNDIELADLATHPRATSVCKELMAAAEEWRKTSKVKLRHIESANDFANAIKNAQSIDCFRDLIKHHEANGGGLRWFVLQGDRIELRTPSRIGSSRYRFRLSSLCRLATQCGVISTMPSAFKDLDIDESQESLNE